MYRFKLKEIELGDTETQKGKKTTVSGIDDETGTITWDVEDVADFSSTYKELEKAKDFLSKLEKTGKSKDDPAIDKLAAQIKELFNTFRTHIRKNYPEEYKRVLRLKESVNEQSEQWTQLDVNNIKKSLRLALKTFNNLVRNLERLEGELGKHSNKPQGNLLQSMAPDSFDYKRVQNKLNKLYNAFSKAFSIDESVNEISNTLTIRDLFGDDFPFDYIYKPESNKIIIPKEGFNDDGTLFDMKDDWKEKIIRTFREKIPNAVAKPNMGGGITVHLTPSGGDFAKEYGDAVKTVYGVDEDKVNEDEIKFNDEEMAKLHKDGQLKKGGHSFKYKLSQSNKDLKEEEVDRDEGEKLSIMKDENGKFIIGMAKGKYPRSKEAGPFDTQQKACEFFSEKGDFILNNLTEERLNEIDINKLKIIGDIYSSCEIPVNEGTFHGPREIAIYDGPDGETYIEKRGTGYYGYNNSFDFEAEDKAELKHKLNSWGYRLIAGSIDEGEGIGYLTPDAFGKNKKDVYTSQYGYKLVPKKIKGAGTIVKQLFEKTDRNEFQTKRIASFKEIEERLNQIYPLLSNAKDKTAEYYNENPGSYSVVYSTDYIFELLDEVEEKLKKTEDK
jgi:hypothetical protein